MHYLIGQIGHFSVIIAFVAALVATYAYVQAHRTPELERPSWRRFARGAFAVHGLAVLGIIVSLFQIIANHYYEYHYAWSHSSNHLPAHYMISCFWEGQEGSFLLWIFWHVLIGLVLMATARQWEAPVMAVFALVQAFLTSMILGVVFFGELKIGSSPFMLLREVMANDEVFKLNPDFVPQDGTGLNPLLQNYWMVIHPPTLFLGFAGTLVPFAFAIAGLATGRYREWVRPALPWALGTALVLGVGIMMGAYWAYETLNFGGYWNWDPVENAVYVPWLILVASIHVMIVFQRSHTALKASFVLVLATFITILYATFLTRSGVLGNASVHSFTDLGLSGQLLIYLGAFALIAVGLLAAAWRQIPTSAEEISAYSREFWIFMGATVLCLSGFQVIVPTSFPVFNKFAELVGFSSNLAPPADQIQFYTKFQLWFGVAIALLSGTGQFFFWRKMDRARLAAALTVPLIVTLLVAGATIVLGQVADIKYIVLLTAGVYALVSNATILVKLFRTGTLKLAGGSVSHMGVALMLLGILASAGYSNVISRNNTGLLYNRQFSDEMNKENLLLFLNQPQTMRDYTLTYRGPRLESPDYPGYLPQEMLAEFGDPHRRVLRDDLISNGKTYFTKGDTIEVHAENVYYQIDYVKANGQTFTLFPRIQYNKEMGNGLVPSPDISRTLGADLYTHITNLADPEQER
ncbi:MAG: cytochrome c biogenesis protein CcsA, partial [Bernardetiaceae bacterium]|nr:cytochrome c biogenesis protein CcsA [Bernardetiaceae bacterium]